MSGKDKLLAKKNQKEIYPMWAEINTYYLQIVIVNKFEAKIFDLTTGKLLRVHENLSPNGADIT